MARSIRLVPGLRDKFDRFVGSWPESVIGLHVRRTDLKAKFSGAGVHDDGKLMDRVDQLLSANPRRKVLLCTDNEASLVLYQNRFGGRVLVFPKSFDDRSADREEKRDTKVEDAACDLYALACTELIAGTRHSSFTEYAAFLGDIRSEAY